MSEFLSIICAWSTILLLVLTEFPFEFSGIWKVCINLLTHWYCRYCSPDRGINGICAASNILSRRWIGWRRNWNFGCSDKYDYNGFTFKPLSVDITIHKIILIVMIVDGQYRWPVQRQLECHVAAEQTQRNWTQPSLATTHNITGLAIFFWMRIVLFQLCHQICRSFLFSSFFPGSTRINASLLWG